MKILTKYAYLLMGFLPCSFLSCEQSNESDSDSEQTVANEIFVAVELGRIATDGGLSRGVAWGDYDNDGDPDLYVANSKGQWNALYRNDGAGNFKKITASGNKVSEVVVYGGNSQGVNWIDYDNDGDLDLYVVSRGDESSFLFRNDSTVAFTRIIDSPLTAEGISASMACWVDIDGDGDIDVFLAGYDHPNLAFKNNGDGKFERVLNATLTTGEEGRARACGCGDINNDGLPDFYIGNARRPNLFFKNLGNWKFERIETGHFVEDIGYTYGVSLADYDEDGDLDLFVANFDKENFLYNNDGDGIFTPITEGNITTEKGGASKGHAWGDYDNDGDLDLYIGNGTYGPDMRNFLYLNQGDGSFERNFDGQIEIHADTSAGVAYADYDRDGDLDLFVANWGSQDQLNRLYENVSPPQHWVTIRLAGKTSNSFGIGAKVHAYFKKKNTSKQVTRWVYPTTGFASQNDYEVHFGLGEITTLDSLVIQWPSGNRDRHKEVPANNHFIAVEKGDLTISN